VKARGLLATAILLAGAGAASAEPLPVSSSAAAMVDSLLGIHGALPAPPADAPSLPPRAQRVLALRDAMDAHAADRVAALLAPDSRVWFESREGTGEKRDPGGKDSFADWDAYFHAEKNLAFVGADSDSVEFRLTETNDFYHLLDRPPSYTRLVYWFDARDRITGTLVQGLAVPAATLDRPHRMDEFKAWQAQRDPAVLADLLPGGKLAHDLTHAKRWKAALVAWRRSAGLPPRP